VSEIGLLRIVAQRLAGEPAATAADAVRWLTAAQAQDPKGVLTSIALRTAGRSRAEVEAAYDAGDVVKSWPMRGTLHLVAAQDLPWMLSLLTPRVEAAAAARRRQLGLDQATLARGGELTVEALRGGRRLRRAELLATWQRGGVDPSAQRGTHLLGHLAMTGVVCFGPTLAGEQQLVLLDEWVPAPHRLEGDEALCELALRFFRSHGPATVQDLARWTGLLVTQARTGAALARPQLEVLMLDGVEHLLDPQTPQRLAAARDEAARVLLLPGFDELLLGYGDRSALLAAEHADRIVPGGNGVFRPTVVAGGRVVGTWRQAGRGSGRTLELEPFARLPARVSAAAEKAHRALP
jgi:hypothetical protein